MSQKAKAVNKSRDHDKYSEAAEEISVPKLILARHRTTTSWRSRFSRSWRRILDPFTKQSSLNAIRIFKKRVCRSFALHLRKFSKNCQRSQDYRSRVRENRSPPGDGFLFFLQNSRMKVPMLPMQIILLPMNPQLMWQLDQRKSRSSILSPSLLRVWNQC